MNKLLEMKEKLYSTTTVGHRVLLLGIALLYVVSLVAGVLFMVSG